MHKELAYNYFNVDPGNNLASSTLSTGGALFSDLQPIWGLLLGIGIAALFIGIVIAFVKSHKG